MNTDVLSLLWMLLLERRRKNAHLDFANKYLAKSLASVLFSKSFLLPMKMYEVPFQFSRVCLMSSQKIEQRKT